MVNLEYARLPDWRAPIGPTTYIRVKRSLPFVESSAGKYTHRVRSIVIMAHDEPLRRIGIAHTAVHCWCGMTILISKKRCHSSNMLVVDPSRVLCATCEGRAIGAGQLGTAEIAGRPVMFSPHRAARPDVP